MPTGRVHGQDSILIGVHVIGLALAEKLNLDIALAIAAGSVSGLILSPDLDQETRTQSESMLIQRFWLIGHLFTWYWYPYAVLFSHRSLFSHAPVIGTAIRLLYCVPFLGLTIFAIGKLGGGVETDVLALRLIELSDGWLQWGVVGLALSDSMHWLRDFWP